MKKEQTTKPVKMVPLQKLLDAKIRLLGGESVKDVSKDLNISPNVLDDRLRRIDELSGSTLPALSVERKIISEAISNHLRPIKEELSLNSLEIVRKADEIILNKLNIEGESLELRDVLKASDSHEARLARITGLEEHPEQGSNPIQDRNNRVSIFIQNMFAGHSDKLSREREIVNENPLTSDK